MDKQTFYEGKSLVEVEWWVSYASEPTNLLWARLRVFSDNSADATFEEFKGYGFGNRKYVEYLVYGFTDRKYAEYFLSEDEYIPFESVDAEEEEFIGIKKTEVSPPDWGAARVIKFEYLGKY